MGLSSQNSGKNRRQVLKSVAAGSTAAGMIGAASGSAAAKGKKATEHARATELRRKYGTAQKARGLFIGQAGGLVADLHEVGVLPEDDIRDFDFERALDGRGTAEISFLTHTSSEDAPVVGRVRLRRETGTYSVSVVVEPSENHAFALAVSEDAENHLAVKGEGLVDTSDGSGDDVSTQGDCTCYSSGCNYSYPCAGSNCCNTDKDNANQVYWPTEYCEGYVDSNGDCQCDCTTYCTDSSKYDYDNCSCTGLCGSCSCW